MVRQEANGQLTLIGVIPGDAIEVQGYQDGPIQLPMLSCVVVLDYMQDISSFEFQCEVNKGAQVIQRTPPQSAVRDRPKIRYHTMLLTFTPIAFPSIGDYQFKVTVKTGGQSTSFSRRLKIEGPAASTPASSRLQ